MPFAIENGKKSERTKRAENLRIGDMMIKWKREKIDIL